jgi:hypothetical protein
MLTRPGSRLSIPVGSGQLTGGAPGLQIRCEGLKPPQVGSIPMHFRHKHLKLLQVCCQDWAPKRPRRFSNPITLRSII